MSDYLHSYNPIEQERLQRQAQFLRRHLHTQTSLKPGQRVLEIGCGVGAQLSILAEFPGVHLVGLDRSSEQLARARELLAGPLADGRVELVESMAEELPFGDEEFDQIFLFFVLEHVRNPQSVLVQARRVVKPDGRLTVTEVNNRSLQVFPHSQAIERLWAAYNQLQIDLGGDPEVGIKLPNLAISSGFVVESFDEIGPSLDARLSQASRLEVVDFWRQLFDSTRQRLLDEGRITLPEVTRAYQDLSELVSRPEAILAYSGRQLVARPDVQA